MRLIRTLPGTAGVLMERNPSQTAASQVVALGIGLAALVFFRARQLLETAVKRFHLPAHLHRLYHHFVRQMGRQVVGSDPFNAPFVATSLKSFTPNGTAFRRTATPWLQPPAGGSNVSRAW